MSKLIDERVDEILKASGKNCLHLAKDVAQPYSAPSKKWGKVWCAGCQRVLTNVELASGEVKTDKFGVAMCARCAMLDELDKPVRRREFAYELLCGRDEAGRSCKWPKGT